MGQGEDSRGRLRDERERERFGCGAANHYVFYERTSEHCSLMMSPVSLTYDEPYGPIGRIVALHKAAFYLLSSSLCLKLAVTQLHSLISVVLDAKLDVVLNVPKPRCA